MPRGSADILQRPSQERSCRHRTRYELGHVYERALPFTHSSVRVHVPLYHIYTLKVYYILSVHLYCIQILCNNTLITYYLLVFWYVLGFIYLKITVFHWFSWQEKLQCSLVHFVRVIKPSKIQCVTVQKLDVSLIVFCIYSFEGLKNKFWHLLLWLRSKTLRVFSILVTTSLVTTSLVTMYIGTSVARMLE